ncbi:hypothetical protein CJEDD_00320 [Corynebacterium jeddahense]|uniref:Uncharacterized protein n=2 Tax=Corynebacterium jeddahense TaxID=1414719 RepID=A0ABY7UG83_9CORY|nr:hypothetical protein CJEDD_00320 [Corynebacterium jeddahense]
MRAMSKKVCSVVVVDIAVPRRIWSSVSVRWIYTTPLGQACRGGTDLSTAWTWSSGVLATHMSLRYADARPVSTASRIDSPTQYARAQCCWWMRSASKASRPSACEVDSRTSSPSSNA